MPSFQLTDVASAATGGGNSCASKCQAVCRGDSGGYLQLCGLAELVSRAAGLDLPQVVADGGQVAQLDGEQLGRRYL